MNTKRILLLLIVLPLIFGFASKASAEGQVHEEHEVHEVHEEQGGHAHGGETWTTELWELVRNPAHWIFEWLNDVVTWAVLFAISKPYIKYRERRAIRKHDAKHHPNSHGVDTARKAVVR